VKNSNDILNACVARRSLLINSNVLTCL